MSQVNGTTMFLILIQKQMKDKNLLRNNAKGNSAWPVCLHSLLRRPVLLGKGSATDNLYSIPQTASLPTLPPTSDWHRSRGNGGYIKTITVCLCHFFLLHICSSLSYPQTKNRKSICLGMNFEGSDEGRDQGNRYCTETIHPSSSAAIRFMHSKKLFLWLCKLSFAKFSGVIWQSRKSLLNSQNEAKL